MLQGTSSNAGKSILTAAFCRIFLQDGLRVAPFKSQNMALNSFVTPDGLELGRAQAVQAAACRREPDVRMNPILLKPCSDTGSQVVVMGRPVGTMRVREYVDYKPVAFAAACSAYDSLAAEVDVMVLEGAGSPAEINLKAHDIVNMAMARHAQAKVLLVGDIDRGGVFASLVGTMELLDPWERDLVAGHVINRFRGDATLLDPALVFTRERTGKPVLGVVPYLHDLGLPEEDSVTFREAMAAGGRLCGAAHGAVGGAVAAHALGRALDIVLLDLEHISNFTDVDALRVEPDVQLRVVRHADALGKPDVIILPGSKNTTGDLRALQARGLDVAVRQLARHPDGPVIVGICGGLQMLGLSVADPLGLEGGGEVEGLGLLPVRTHMAEDKQLRRTSARCVHSGNAVQGYEIHHGVTFVEGEVAVCLVCGDHAGDAVTGHADAAGWASTDGRVWGTYLHGIFDADPFRRAFLDSVRVRRGLPPVGEVVASYSLEPALDRLAATVREHVDMAAVYALVGL